MSGYFLADLEAARRRRARRILAGFWVALTIIALLTSAAAPAAAHPDQPAAAPAVSGPAASSVPHEDAATIAASLTPPPTMPGLAAGSEGRQAATATRDRGARDVAVVVAPAGTDVPTLVQVSGGLALMVPPLGTAGVSLPAVPAPTVWDDLAACESHGEWDYDPATATWGNRLFSGGLQFLPATWAAFAPDGFPGQAHEASREQQIAVAERVLDAQGWVAWPACSKRLGLR